MLTGERLARCEYQMNAWRVRVERFMLETLAPWVAVQLRQATTWDEKNTAERHVRLLGQAMAKCAIHFRLSRVIRADRDDAEQAQGRRITDMLLAELSVEEIAIAWRAAGGKRAT